MKHHLLSYLLVACAGIGPLAAQSADSSLYFGHFFSTDLLHVTRPGYQPWNLQYEWVFQKRNSICVGLGLFSRPDKPASSVAGVRSYQEAIPQTGSSGSGSSIFKLLAPSNELKVAYHHRGVYASFGIRSWFGKPANTARWFFSMGLQAFYFRYDEIFMWRSLVNLNSTTREVAIGTQYTLDKTDFQAVFYGSAGLRKHLWKRWYATAEFTWLLAKE
jgi:hypothetical protein